MNKPGPGLNRQLNDSNEHHNYSENLSGNVSFFGRLSWIFHTFRHQTMASHQWAKKLESTRLAESHGSSRLVLNLQSRD